MRYHGGKWRISSWIISHFPEHRIYVEPFGGGAGVLLRKERSYAEVYNDINDEIVNVFRQLRDNGEELKRRLTLTPFARKEFEEAYLAPTDQIDAARKTVIKSFMSFGSDAIFRYGGFRSNTKRNGTIPAHDWRNYADALDALIKRLRGVVIECRDYKQIIPVHDTPNTLFYVDPPYLFSTRGDNKRYANEMSDDEHVELAGVLKTLKGKVVLSGYPSPLYDELYGGWIKTEREAMADGARLRTEVLWRNFT